MFSLYLQLLFPLWFSLLLHLLFILLCPRSFYMSFLHSLSVLFSVSFFHPFSYLHHPPTPFTLSFTLFTPLSAHTLILSSLIPPLPSHSSHPPSPPFSLTLSQSPPSSLHTVTSFLLPVRTPWFEATPPPLLPPPPGMKCSCSMVFCLFAANASLLAL